MVSLVAYIEQGKDLCLLVLLHHSHKRRYDEQVKERHAVDCSEFEKGGSLLMEMPILDQDTVIAWKFI